MNKPRGMKYVSDSAFVWGRKKQGKKLQYVNGQGKALRPKEEERVKKLAIPPAWIKVKICPDPHGHIQAVGFDAKGRKQYIYHPDWIAFNQRHKFDSMKRFGEILPTLRETVAGHMRQRTLSKERILATVVWLLEHTFIRVGNETYAKDNKSYGLTTLRNKHVEVEGNTIKFSFKGKSHVYHELDIRHPRVATTIRECIELPGYQLFQYVDEDDNRHKVDSADVNNYLKTITGESLSAKDFRTWGGTTLAGDRLYTFSSQAEPLTVEDALSQTVEEVASHLGNTVAVCRKYYIHPKVISSHEKKTLVPHFSQIYKSKKDYAGLTAQEYATLSLLVG